MLFKMLMKKLGYRTLKINLSMYWLGQNAECYSVYRDNTTTTSLNIESYSVYNWEAWEAEKAIG